MRETGLSDFIIHSESVCNVCGFRCTKLPEGRLLQDSEGHLYSNRDPIVECINRNLILNDGIDIKTAQQSLEGVKGERIC